MDSHHVLHLSSESTWRGGEQQLAYLIEESQHKGIRVAVACRRGSAFHDWCVEKAVTCFPLGFKNGFDVRTALQIRGLTRRHDISVVHSHSGKSQSLAYLALRLGMKTDVIAHRRVDFPLKDRGPSLAKYNHPKVKAIICVSEVIAEMVREKVVNPDRVTVVYSGVDFSRFSNRSATGFIHRELNWDADSPLVANISALAPHKDYHTFVRTAASVLQQRPDCRFLMVGEGNMRAELEQYAAECLPEGSYAFLGFREDVPAIMRELTLFLITSKTEGLGTTVIDAMHNHLPIVATQGGGIPELISDGKSGYLCPVGDAACLSDRVIEVLEDPEKRKALGDGAFRGSRAFGKEQMARGVFAVYDRVANAQKV